MKGARAWLLGIAGAAVLLFGGCHKGSTATPINLDRFGGRLTLRLNVNRGDKFEYQAVDEISARSGSGGYGYTTTETREAEVIERSSDGFRICFTQLQAKVESENAAIQRKRTRSVKRMQGVHVDGMYGRLGALVKVQAASDDPLVQDEVAGDYGSDPGMFGIVFPEDGLAIGARWTATTDLSSLVGIGFGALGDPDAASKTPIEYTLAGAEEDEGRTLAVIDYRMDLEPRKSGSAAGPQNFDKLKMLDLGSMSVKASGTARVDVATGMVFRDESTVTIKTNLLGIASTVTTKSSIQMTRGR